MYHTCVLIFNKLGCGGLSLTTPESFTAARTSDLKECIQYLSESYPSRPLVAIGYSLGAGILLNYLGQQQEIEEVEAASGSNVKLKAAVACSPSWDFRIMTSVFPIWSRFVLSGGMIISIFIAYY